MSMEYFWSIISHTNWNTQVHTSINEVPWCGSKQNLIMSLWSPDSEIPLVQTHQINYRGLWVAAHHRIYISIVFMYDIAATYIWLGVYIKYYMDNMGCPICPHFKIENWQSRYCNQLLTSTPLKHVPELKPRSLKNMYKTWLHKLLK